MIKAKYLMLLILFISLCMSCRHGVNIILENKSDTVFDSILIQTDFNKMKLKKIKKNESHTLFVNFKNSKHKGDGVFILQMFDNGQVKNQQFGYFSNGIPPSDNFIIEIYNDTIIIKECFN